MEVIYELAQAIEKAIELKDGEEKANEDNLANCWTYDVVILIDKENGNHKAIIKAYDQWNEYAGRF